MKKEFKKFNKMKEKYQKKNSLLNYHCFNLLNLSVQAIPSINVIKRFSFFTLKP